LSEASGIRFQASGLVGRALGLSPPQADADALCEVGGEVGVARGFELDREGAGAQGFEALPRVSRFIAGRDEFEFVVSEP